MTTNRVVCGYRTAASLVVLIREVNYHEMLYENTVFWCRRCRLSFPLYGGGL